VPTCDFGDAAAPCGITLQQHVAHLEVTVEHLQGPAEGVYMSTQVGVETGRNKADETNMPV